MKHKHRPCPCGCGELADECMKRGSGLNAFSGWRPVTEWDSPESPPCEHDPDEPGTEEFFPDPDAEPPF